MRMHVVRCQEIMAIMVGLSTFSGVLAGRSVVLYGDNKGAEGATSKGSAKVRCTHGLVLAR